MHLIVHLVVGRIQMQMFKECIKMQLQFYGGIWMHIQMLNIQMRIQMHLYLLTSLIDHTFWNIL